MSSKYKLVPELYCSNLAASLDFYCRLLGFSVLYERPEERFAYVALSGVEVMLDEIISEETHNKQSWITGKLEKPLGRGMNLQFEVNSADDIYTNLIAAEWPIFRTIHNAWYRRDNVEQGNRQFLVLDPDGYQLRPFTDLGERGVGGKGNDVA